MFVPCFMMWLLVLQSSNIGYSILSSLIFIQYKYRSPDKSKYQPEAKH